MTSAGGADDAKVLTHITIKTLNQTTKNNVFTVSETQMKWNADIYVSKCLNAEMYDKVYFQFMYDS